MADIDGLINHAIELQNLGKVNDARRVFNQILAMDPYNFIALYSIAIIQINVDNDFNLALTNIDLAIRINPRFAQAWFVRGVLLQQMGQADKALKSYDEAVLQDPANIGALINRGVLQRSLGRIHDALQSFRQALENDPENISAKANFEIVQAEIKQLSGQALNTTLATSLELQGAGNHAAARIGFENVLLIEPGNHIALYSLALIHLNFDNKPELALQTIDKAVLSQPGFAQGWFARGVILQALGRNEESLASYDRAVGADEHYVAALINRGALLRDMHRHHDAIASFNKAVEIEPDNVLALGNFGILLSEFKQHEAAITRFTMLMQKNPAHENVLGLLLYEKLHICDWNDFSLLRNQIEDGLRNGRRVCKSLALMSMSDSAELQFKCAEMFASGRFNQENDPAIHADHYHHERIRLGYISPDFREHPVGQLIVGVLEAHDRKIFEIYAYSIGTEDGSARRQRIINACDHFHDIRTISNKDAAKLIRSHEIDILIDLAGYTSDSRTKIMSWHPATTQINFLGYPGTMAVPYYEYILADQQVIPESHEVYYSEHVLRMPNCYLPTDASLIEERATPARSLYGLPEHGSILCSFNHEHKINPDVFDCWMAIMHQLPDSVLWLMGRTELIINNLRREAESRGISGERLIFASRVPSLSDHLARYQLADLFLDTFPYNAHTTASDALLSGLPVVTLEGNAFPSRVAASLLKAVGLTELIAHSKDEYIHIAVRMVNNPVALTNMKSRLNTNKRKFPLFDTTGFCRDLESVLVTTFKNKDENRPFVGVRRSMTFGLEKSNTDIYDRIVMTLANGFKANGHPCLTLDPESIKSLTDLTQIYNQCDWVVITNNSGFLSLKVEGQFLFEALPYRFIFIHHDMFGHTSTDLNEIREKVDAYIRIKDRSVHFTIEKRDEYALRCLGISAHPIAHINTLGTITRPVSKIPAMDISFIGHAVPSNDEMINWGMNDSEYFSSYKSRFRSFRHSIRDEFLVRNQISYNNETFDASAASNLIQYLQCTGYYSLFLRGAVLQQLNDRTIDLFGGDPAWIHGLEQTRTFTSKNINTHKPVFDTEKVSGIFSNTKINLNVTHLQFDSGLINRVVDCYSAGGFMLTDHKQQLFELTGVADEICYSSIDELRQKIDFFIHPARAYRRIELIHQIQEDFSNRCSAEFCVSQILKNLPK